MKLSNFLSTTAVAVVAISGSLSAIDSEFASLNRVQAQIKGSQYKAAARNAAQPHHAHLGGTDMDTFFNAVNKPAGNVDVAAAINEIRALFVANTEAVVDGYAANDGDAILDAGGAVVAAHQGKTRLAVKQDIVNAINGVNIAGIDGPVDGNYGTIKAFVEAIENSVRAAVTTTIHTYALDDGDAILGAGAPVVGAHQGETREVFLQSLLAALEY